MAGDIAPRWDYTASVERVRPMVINWRTMTVDLLHELCEARKALSHSPADAARVMHGTNVPRRTWSDYCTDIGLEKRTANRWLQRWDDDTRTILELPEPEPARPIQEEPRRRDESVVDDQPDTSERPKGKHLTDEQAEKITAFNDRMRREDAVAKDRPAHSSTSKVEMDELLRRADECLAQAREAAERFSHLTLSGGADNEVQGSMLDLVRRYVMSFEPAARRTEVAHNLIKALRVVIHEVNDEAEP